SSSSSSPLKKKINLNLTITNSKSNRNNSNNKLTIKQQANQTTKINDAKTNSTEQPSLTTAITSASSVPRKILPKDNYSHMEIFCDPSKEKFTATLRIIATITMVFEKFFKKSLMRPC
ncbi:unnamed protein product, partial [Rotaria magnacalcarata]